MVTKKKVSKTPEEKKVDYLETITICANTIVLLQLFQLIVLVLGG